MLSYLGGVGRHLVQYDGDILCSSSKFTKSIINVDPNLRYEYLDRTLFHFLAIVEFVQSIKWKY